MKCPCCRGSGEIPTVELGLKRLVGSVRETDVPPGAFKSAKQTYTLLVAGKEEPDQ